MAGDREKKAQEREKLRNLISQWNANRLDIFWLTEPNEDLEFHGAMRFYFQDAGEKVATKCIRVSSTASTADVVKTLIEKFRPDIRMLSIPEYALYEIHENGEERKLADQEKPLLVQLDWHKDDREGRFLLRRMDEKSYISSMDSYDNENFRRKLSKREKKEKKKREKKERQQQGMDEKKKDGIAERLYSELPETVFTRSISNPEAVMRRRRQQILEKKLQQFCQEGGTDAGGTLRIFGESLNKDVPYKTLLLSMKDTAAYVVKEILEKYGYEKEDPSHYCLVQVIILHQPQPEGSHGQDFQSNNIREYILDDDDCPLMIEHQFNRSRGTLTFHVRRRPADYQPRKRKKKPKPSKSESDTNSNYRDDTLEKLPYLLELNPDGSEIHGPAKKHRLYLNVTEVGSERSSSTRQYLQLFGPNVQPRHCVIAHTEGIVTVTPSSREAETHVNNVRIYETTILQPGMVVRFGKLHTFRFVDPLHTQKHRMLPDPRQSAEFLDRSARREDQLSLHHHGSYETTFDADGNVETVSTHSRDDRMSKKSDDANSHRSLGRESSHGRGSYEKHEPKRGNDPILPAVLEFREEGEDEFLSRVISQLDQNHVQFKLSPTYILYMAARFRASTHFRPKSSPNDRAKRLTALMNKIASLIHQVIQERYRDASSLAFWLANASELLHFLKQDRHVSAYTLDAQDLLAESVQLAFRGLVTCEQSELQAAMPMFLEQRDDMGEEEGCTAEVLAVLSSAMSLLKRCRVNAALTIQMFSQLFHYINMWLFNKVVCDNQVNLCTRSWGICLKRRLGRVEAWAEKQGLELAADCHLSKIVQAAHLLQAPKSSSKDFTSISSECYKLNSLQLKTLLEKYQPVGDEPPVPPELIESVIKVAENTADEFIRSEGREVKLEDDADLQLPFLLPEDGYSCDVVRDVPAGLKEFLDPLVHAGLCRLTIQPTSSGFWTIYMSDQDIGRMPRACSPSIQSNTGEAESTGGWNQTSPSEPEIVTISLQKSNNGIGLSIVAAGGMDQDRLGIYIKSVVKGGAADLDGRLQAGDQLLKVDGQSLVGVNQEKAAELMTRTGPVVSLEVAKQGAIFNGLADLLSKPSPIIQRGNRRMSERDIPSRIMSEHAQDGRLHPGHNVQPRMQSSKSVPSLNSNHHQEPVPPAQVNSRVQETYNPAYSRTSSTTSIPKSTEYSEKSRSASNLRQDVPGDGRYPYPTGQGEPPPYPGPPAGGMNLRPTSQPNLHQPVPPPVPQHHSNVPVPQAQVPVQEERHYQNISMYQQQLQLPPQQQQQPQNVYPHARSPSQPLPPQPARSHHGSQSSLNRPEVQGVHSSSDRSRPLSTLVSPREQEQYANSLGYSHSPTSGPPQPLPKGSLPSPQGGVDPRHIHHPHGPRLHPDHRDFRSTGHIGHPEGERKYTPDQMAYNEQFGRGYPGPKQHPPEYSPNIDPRQRDLLRQEAKMEEMREEVRRREERERMLHHQQQIGRGYSNWPQPRMPNASMRPPVNYHHGGPAAPANHQQYVGGPPPPAPKPRQVFSPTGERFQCPRYEHPVMNGQGVNSYPEARPPMGSPSMSHQNNPRFAANPPPPVVSYRYGPSGYPPRSAAEDVSGKQPRPDPRQSAPQGKSGPQNNSNSRVTFDVHSPTPNERKECNLTSPSPWEREEKEKLHKQRLAAARQARDAEIRELESFQFMSPQQKERLRTLRLEQEFQRRAEELRAEEEEDDDDDLLDRAENRERMLKVQEDLERARQRRLEWEQEQMHQTQQQQPNKPHHQQLQQQQHSAHEEWRKQNSQLEEQEGRLRHLRLEEVNRKRELEATRNAEERLLREARRRQDEMKMPLPAHQPPSRPAHLPVHHQNAANSLSQHVAPNYHHHQDVPHIVESRDTPPPLPTSPPPVEQNHSVANQNHLPLHKNMSSINSQVRTNENYQSEQSSIVAPHERQLLEPPAPPQRKSSYEVTNHLSPGGMRYSPATVKNDEGHATPHQSKKVSFHDPRSEENVSCDANGNAEKTSSYTLDDIDEVLATPHNTQNLNTYNPGKTPGVIGAQEVYRDPRQRIEAERNQQENHSNRNLGPEKLTFKEKMKMFAQETGEQETPKDKVKISRAQRDIETNLNGN